MSVRKYIGFDDDFEGLDTMSSSSTRSSSRTSRNQKEEERIEQVLFDPKVNPYRVPPVNYKCNRCNQKGHFIYDCPQKPSKANDTVKRSTGIPRSFLKAASVDTPGAKINPHGKLLYFPIDNDFFQSNMILLIMNTYLQSSWL